MAKTRERARERVWEGNRKHESTRERLHAQRYVNRERERTFMAIERERERLWSKYAFNVPGHSIPVSMRWSRILVSMQLGGHIFVVYGLFACL